MIRYLKEFFLYTCLIGLACNNTVTAENNGLVNTGKAIPKLTFKAMPFFLNQSKDIAAAALLPADFTFNGNYNLYFKSNSAPILTFAYNTTDKKENFIGGMLSENYFYSTTTLQQYQQMGIQLPGNFTTTESIDEVIAHYINPMLQQNGYTVTGLGEFVNRRTTTETPYSKTISKLLYISRNNKKREYNCKY